MKTALLISIVVGLLSSCSSDEPSDEDTNSENFEILLKDTNLVIFDNIINDTSQNKAVEEVDELLKKFTWNEVSIEPSASKINNPLFTKNLLFKNWAWSDKDSVAFRFDKDSFDPFHDLPYVYTINYDSLRIFTQAEHVGGGVERGIIKKLTEDSLIIKWSTDDYSKYISVK